MTASNLSRRDFAKASGLACVAALLPALPSFAAAGKSVRLGGPSYSKAQDPEELALAHRKLGYRAAFCPKVELKDTDRIKAISAAFAKHDVVLAEVGRWKNLLEADPQKRKENLDFVTEGLALAEAIGALCCVDIAGSYHPTVWYGPHADNFTPKFFDAIVENARKIIDAVKPTRAKFTYEVMGWAYPEGPDSYLKLIKAIDRKAFGVHLDVCNAVNSPERFYRNTDLINDCFDKLGPYIASCHAKDLIWDVELNVHFREIIPGQGSIDYATYLKRVAALPQQAPLMLEHLKSAEEYDQARQYIMGVGQKNGIDF